MGEHTWFNPREVQKKILVIRSSNVVCFEIDSNRVLYICASICFHSFYGQGNSLCLEVHRMWLNIVNLTCVGNISRIRIITPGGIDLMISTVSMETCWSAMDFQSLHTLFPRELCFLDYVNWCQCQSKIRSFSHLWHPEYEQTVLCSCHCPAVCGWRICSRGTMPTRFLFPKSLHRKCCFDIWVQRDSDRSNHMFSERSDLLCVIMLTTVVRFLCILSFCLRTVSHKDVSY